VAPDCSEHEGTTDPDKPASAYQAPVPAESGPLADQPTERIGLGGTLVLSCSLLVCNQWIMLSDLSQ